MIIISCSAHINNKKILSCGINYYLTKPIILKELSNILYKISNYNEKIFNFDKVPLLDHNRFLEIQKLMGNKFIDFIELYYKNCLELVEDIKKSLVSTDQELLILASHKLKSSSSNIGALRISTTCTELEKISLENNNNTAKFLIETLENSVRSTSAEYNKYI
jgi:HPt (histidine-containing phosphotransfer) domain-containing protein